MLVDVLILNGLVLDGSGRQGCKQPVAIKGEKIVLPQSAAGIVAAKEIDAKGLVVAPGFIDIHSHTTLRSLLQSRGGSKLSQGVTTEITGNCGMLPAPLAADGVKELSTRHIDWSPEGYSQYLAQFTQHKLPLNIGILLGHGSIRAAVLGYARRRPSGPELRRMKDLVAEGMRLGAMGLSSGLGYAPGMFADTDELVVLAKAAAQGGGIYATHMRNEGGCLLASVDEAVETARLAQAPLQVSHLKAVGRPNWGKVTAAIAKLDAASHQGMDVHYDFYPYTASSTGLSSQLPDWVHEGGWEMAAQRLQHPAHRERIVEEVVSLEAAVGMENIIVSQVKSPGNQKYEGKSLRDIGSMRGQPPAEAMLDLLVEEGGDVGMIKFSMCEEDVKTVAGGRLSLVGSDGSAIAVGDLENRMPHPRSFGTFPRVLRWLAREQKLFRLETAIHKMSGAPAKKLGLAKRGLIKDGYYADLVLFAADKITDNATYDNPHQLAAGIHSVYVNGKMAYIEGRFVDAGSGVFMQPRR